MAAKTDAPIERNGSSSKIKIRIRDKYIPDHISEGIETIF
jgi:hypothetical protein